MSAPAAGGLLVVADRVLAFDDNVASSPSAVLVRHGRIAAVGAAADLLRAARGAEVLEFPGGSVLPGLTDSHIHLTEWALARREADLSGARSPDEVAGLAFEAARAQGEWVRGRGWDPHRWGGAYPDRARLDALLPDRAVVLQSHDMHALWVNGETLRRAGIGRGTADPEGGRILRDADGEPTGVLLENAGQLVTRVLPSPGLEAREDAVLDAQAQLHAWGITGVHAFPSIHIPDPEPLAVLESLRELDRLRLRVLRHIPLGHLDRAIASGIRSGFGGGWIRIGGVKMFLDGALGSRTAWMQAPYEGSADRGVEVIGLDEFRGYVRRAAAAGIATTVHAIGDAAVARALDVLAANPVTGTAVPHRIEHVQCVPPGRLRDAGRAGIACSVQPAHLMTDWLIADRHWGAARTRTTYPFRSLAAHGAVLAFGSDAPVESADPRLGLHAAVHRTDRGGQPPGGWQPDERISIEAAFRGYTIGPALAAGQPGGGRIRVGAYADFAVWAGNPLDPEGSDLLGLECMATVAGGELVHS